ncbi:uncharacterized protein PAN0_001d0314 [Moesziomyces antarcticus]|uniref:Uncharacterized protein n=1 Tax=Pseudozyma antarctica TaxID=84753 RepID=A0A5C3FE31_PSEA2|nr:uncharacterized protein PAN0_001d0314 [Moesziomyces antarcticus]GAK62117.1 conserved hypothetical protein [Moesziomyces antarcticus]SPO42648.1 uncharacterized protein PSANT_00331 [Moesziomyces antarcticus]
MKLFVVPVTVVLACLCNAAAYKHDAEDGQAEIGAYHIQPGRCAGVEQRLGHTKYSQYYHWSPFHTSFTELGYGNDVEQMDSTALCANNPALTQGYGGGFDKMRIYLVYGRCVYGTQDMKVMCGTITEQGRPSHNILNVVQASCPAGTRCKNLCATMQDPSLTSKFAVKQVQLAQCMPIPQWKKLTEMYRPKASPVPAAYQVAAAGSQKIDPKVVDKAPAGNPTVDPVHVDKDGTIPGRVVSPSTPPTDDIDADLLKAANEREAYSGERLVTKQPDVEKPVPAQPAKGDSSDLPIGGPQFVPAAKAPEAQTNGHKLEHQQAPTRMGFRKRSLSGALNA